MRTGSSRIANNIVTINNIINCLLYLKVIKIKSMVVSLNLVDKFTFIF